MHPNVFADISSYFAAIVVAFVVSIIWAQRQGERVGLDGNAVLDTGMVVIFLAILGARLLAVLTDGFLDDFINLCTDPKLVDAVDAQVRFCSENAQCGYDYLCNLDARDAVVAGDRKTMCYPPKDCLAALKFWQGGLTYYGGFLLSVPGGILFARWRGIGAVELSDIGAPATMLGLAVGRIGCFFNGCCYGGATDSWVGVRFPTHTFDTHATQLYEGVTCVLIFLALHFYVRPRKRGHGEVFAWLLVLYGGLRMLIEVFRADQRGSLGPLSTSQVISIPLILLGAFLIVRIRRRAKPLGRLGEDPKTDAE